MKNIRQKEEQKRSMELGFLQAQINPHFMYNTLFSVKCMVDMKKNKEASDMLVCFIALLRSTLSEPDEFETVEKEFMLLEKYADIQKLRYSGRIEFICECDEDVKDKKIPKLLIQPLVENAIFHGIEFKKDGGTVIVRACMDGENVNIIVEDDGVGIENVRERIQLNFGDRYGMKIESAEWKGTKVLLYFPAIA